MIIHSKEIIQSNDNSPQSHSHINQMTLKFVLWGERLKKTQSPIKRLEQSILHWKWPLLWQKFLMFYRRQMCSVLISQMCGLCIPCQLLMCILNSLTWPRGPVPREIENWKQVWVNCCFWLQGPEIIVRIRNALLVLLLKMVKFHKGPLGTLVNNLPTTSIVHGT